MNTDTSKCMKNSFLITISRSENTSNDVLYTDTEVSLKVNEPNQHYIRYDCSRHSGFKLFFGERKDAEQPNYETPVNGTSVLYDSHLKKVTIVCDEVGAECLYYKESDGEVRLSNRLDNLVNSGDTPNWKGILCFLSFGYTLQDSTFFESVKQTLPYQSIVIDTSSRELNIENHEPEHENSYQPQDHSYLTSFFESFKNSLNDYGPMALMMSAGWDSRCLLAPKSETIKLAYTHGDLSSRETRISKRLTGINRKDHLFKDVENLKIDNDLLDEIIEKNGHCLWPIWHLSSELISNAHSLPITSGVIGARFGGHNGFPSFGSRKQKIINSFHLITPRLVPESKIVRDIKSSTSIPDSFWFISKKGQKILTEHQEATTREIHQTVDHYVSTNDDFCFAIERFNYNHISRQYMMKQPAMARSFSGYYSPMSRPELLNMVYQIPFKYRIHNRLSKQLIQYLNPSLLEFPMAATLVKAKRPLFVQELSRVVRIVGEKLYHLVKGANPSLGWFNYEHLYDQNVFFDVIESLNSGIWDKERMIKTIEKNKENNIDAGSTLDMICKVKTIDYYLTLSEWQDGA